MSCFITGCAVNRHSNKRQADVVWQDGQRSFWYTRCRFPECGSNAIVLMFLSFLLSYFEPPLYSYFCDMLCIMSLRSPEMSKVLRLLIYEDQSAKAPLIIWDPSQESLDTGYSRGFRVSLVSIVVCMFFCKHMENLHYLYLLISTFFSPIIHSRSKTAS